MICTVRTAPVAGFVSDLSLNQMSNRLSQSPPRLREGTFPVRTALPQEPSKQEMETENHTQSNPPGLDAREQEQNTPSPYDHQNHNSPSNQRQISPSVASTDRMQREDSQAYAPVITQSDSIPSGQVCR